MQSKGDDERLAPPEPGRGSQLGDLNRCLLIFNDRILDSRVVDGIPSFLAAPEGPDTRPRVSARAASIIFFSPSGATFETVAAADSPARAGVRRAGRERARGRGRRGLHAGHRHRER